MIRSLELITNSFSGCQIWPKIGKLQKIEYLDKEKGTLGEIKAFP